MAKFNFHMTNGDVITYPFDSCNTLDELRIYLSDQSLINSFITLDKDYVLIKMNIAYITKE